MIEFFFEGRSIINFDVISLSIRIPFKKNWGIILFMTFWMGGWFMGEKLFFVGESKGSDSLYELSPKEKDKIDCGIKHFQAIGSEIIVANDIMGSEEFLFGEGDK